jgi:hypothetical protein
MMPTCMPYAIIVHEHDADHEVVLCHVGTNPDYIAEAARKKMLYVDGEAVPKYLNVRIEEIRSGERA